MPEYNIYQINDLSNSKVNNILRIGITEDMFSNDDILKNYLYSYRHDPANLFHMLHEGRYKNSCYFVIVDQQDQFIASAGWNHYDNDTALVLTRMVVHPKYRTKYLIGNLVLPIMLEQTEKYKKVWITANDYNQSIYKWFDRNTQGKSSALYSNWPPVYKKFKPIGKQKVNHIEQWVAELEK